MITPKALYEILSTDLDATIQRRTTITTEEVPLDVKRFAAQYLKDKFLSKELPADTKDADRKALEVFQESNDRCGAWNLNLESSADEELVGEFGKILEDFFLQDLGSDVELSWENISLNAKCGPGSAIGAWSTSSYGKLYAGPLTCSCPGLVEQFYRDVYEDPRKIDAEISRFIKHGPIVAVPGSRSSFVPKTNEVSRMISVEPTVNMYYQLGLGELITRRLYRFFGIDLYTQPGVNRYLAYLGSCIDSTFGDGFATIDLSSASDSISLGLIGRFVPPDWLDALLSLRSHTTQIKVGSKSVDTELNMVSTMGNGFTFPLQTAIFASIAAASVSLSDPIRTRPRAFSWSSAGMYSVFGDDIIVPSKSGERTLRLLRLLGFKPNDQKCFVSGSFRESCGHDYYRGYNVRPVFLRKWEGESDLVVMTNLLADWSARLQIPISRTLDALLSSWKTVNLVPMSEGEDSGLRVPYAIVRTYRRDNPLNRDVQSVMYTKRVPHTKRVRFLSEGLISFPKGVKRFSYNPQGLMLSFLRGEIRGGSISLRDWKPLYRTKRAVSPNWDWQPTAPEALPTGSATGSATYLKWLRFFLEPIVARRMKRSRATARRSAAPVARKRERAR